MPRLASKPLTAKTVENARPPKIGYVETFDAAAPGMCLRVTAKGAKTYIVSTRVAGKQKRVTLGHATGPDAITLAEARRLAEEAKDRARAGLPVHRHQRPEPEPGVMTFGTIATDYMARETPRLANRDIIENYISGELLPRWRDIPLPALRKRHARELTDGMVETRPAAAHKIHEIYCRVLNWALGHYDDDELGIEVSPFANLRPPVSKVKRDRALRPGEISTLWRAWDAVGYPFGDLQRLLLLTAQRRGEVAGAAWDEFDLGKRAWTIPASRAKSNRAHIVPLSDQAIDVLRAVPRFVDGDFVFTTTGGRRPVSGYSKGKAATDRKVLELVETDGLDPVGDWRWHDMRRTARTGMAELGVPEIVSERVLNHAPRGLVAIYNVFEYRDEKAAALQRWANRVSEIVTPPPRNVVKINDPKVA